MIGKLLNDLNTEGKKDGMRMNKKKAKIMCNGNRKDDGEMRYMRKLAVCGLMWHKIEEREDSCGA